MKIIYEDKDVLVIDKPAGINVHGRTSAELEGTVAGYFKNKISDTDNERPGIVHRLDKNTSGLMIIAKNTKAKAFLQSQFKNRSVEKAYIVLVEGRLKHAQAILNWPIARNAKNPLKRAVRAGGKPAVTQYRETHVYPGYTLLEAHPKTGRTHQIRVHFAHLGHPVAGDITYGAKKSALKRQFLHAKSLKITLPNGEVMSFSSELPEDLSAFMKTITLQNS